VEVQAERDVLRRMEWKPATKKRTAEMAREFVGYCRKSSDAFDTLNVPRELKVAKSLNGACPSTLRWTAYTLNQSEFPHRSHVA
jgi:hypothetical protein